MNPLSERTVTTTMVPMDLEITDPALRANQKEKLAFRARGQLILVASIMLTLILVIDFSVALIFVTDMQHMLNLSKSKMGVQVAVGVGLGFFFVNMGVLIYGLFPPMMQEAHPGKKRKLSQLRGIFRVGGDDESSGASGAGGKGGNSSGGGKAGAAIVPVESLDGDEECEECAQGVSEQQSRSSPVSVPKSVDAAAALAAGSVLSPSGSPVPVVSDTGLPQNKPQRPIALPPIEAQLRTSTSVPAHLLAERDGLSL